ncbi:adhesion G protein-coupled receptor F5-like isoform X2 [Parambassis ranga]|nr:adhesion G protein-coupled receptor F5-like isoform X2 [Parambassis ranga]
MALPRRIGFEVLLLVIACSLVGKGLLGTETSVHRREKRLASTALNATDHEFQVLIRIADLKKVQLILDNIVFPVLINKTGTIDSVNMTTVCSLNTSTGYQCKCEESFVWSNNTCSKYDVCDAVPGNTCGCINSLPDDGLYCQPRIAPTTTPSPAMTTPSPATTTTPSPTTTTTPSPATTTTPTPLKTEERIFTFTLNIDFDPAYTNINNVVYKAILNAIETQCKKYISNVQSYKILELRSGSTIASYSVSAAPSFQDSEIKSLQVGMFTQLAATYPSTFDSPDALQFNPTEVFFGKSVTVTCGPPPLNLSFGSDWTAEWRLDGNLISTGGKYSLSTQGGASKLTVSSIFTPGYFECKLIRTDRSVFRQISNGNFKDEPQITVNPVKQIVDCKSTNVLLNCSVNSPYQVEFVGESSGSGNNISYLFTIPVDCKDSERKFTCQSNTNPPFTKDITLVFSTERIVCSDRTFGEGPKGYKAVIPCRPNEVGERTAICKANEKFEDEQNSCVLKPIQELLVQSEVLDVVELPKFLDQLSNVTANFTEEVVNSTNNIIAVTVILDNVANTTSSFTFILSTVSMEDVLLSAGVLTIDRAKDQWKVINANNTNSSSVSSTFLQSLETITHSLTSGSFNIPTEFIFLNKTTFTDTFTGDFNSSVEIDIPAAAGGNKSITVITFSSMDNVLPARDQVNSSNNIINGRVVLIQSNSTINNISLTFDVLKDDLEDPKCVFWNFTLFNGLGGWDDKGCQLEKFNETVTCRCDHLTSFSILMSPDAPDDPVLDYITYIGVGISMASLVICLIIEAVVWRKIRRNNVSYLRHVSVVNIAVSLLIANIWFIIGASISVPERYSLSACTAATFFIHLFYLALFFWMLASALLLIYRTISVFDGGLSRRAMMAIGFSLGYGAPLIIVTITIAVTAPTNVYTRGTGTCWLNWYESKALLAFVIPALSIVAINLIILLVVIYKILKRRSVGNAAQAGEVPALLVIARSLAVLTPIFGITWGLGVGTMTSPNNRGIHIAFAFFNSLQGFFILVFGTLLDKQVRSEITAKSQTSTSGTKSTSAGASSSSGLGRLRIWRRRKGGYNVSSADSDSSINT